jgi:NAD(P)-dependent dehydrogenase (short-subunit alcohol dehydrogenase family)
VCNAGSGIGGSIEDVALADAVHQFDANVFGTLRMLRAALPGMRRRRSGLVLVMGSAAGRIAVPFQGHYSATKFALEGLVESLRLELLPFGIRAALIEPGDTRTGFTDSRRTLPTSPEYAEAARRAIGVMEKDERSGAAPERVGALALRLARKRSLRVRYPIGPAFQLLALGLKRVLPSRVFEAFLAVYYKVPRSGAPR